MLNLFLVRLHCSQNLRQFVNKIMCGTRKPWLKLKYGMIFVLGPIIYACSSIVKWKQHVCMTTVLFLRTWINLVVRVIYLFAQTYWIPFHICVLFGFFFYFFLFLGFRWVLLFINLTLTLFLSSAIISKLLQKSQSQRLKWLGQHGKRGLMLLKKD